MTRSLRKPKSSCSHAVFTFLKDCQDASLAYIKREDKCTVTVCALDILERLIESTVINCSMF